MKNLALLCFSFALFSFSSARLFSSVIPSAAPSSAVNGGDYKNSEVNFSAFTEFDLSDIINLPNLSNFNLSSLKVPPTVNSICSGTDYAAECIVSILPFLREFRRFEPKPIDILRMEIDALQEKANSTLDLAKRLISDQSTPQEVADVLDVCVDNYESLIDDLSDAAVAVDDGDFGRLESVVSAAIADVVTCSDAFTEQPEIESPMIDVDEFLKKLCSNVLAISQMVFM